MAEESKNNEQCDAQRQPAIFVNHGGGPMPYLQHKGKQVMFDSTFIIASLKNLGEYINKYKPKALCIVSAHWEASKPSVLYHKSPELYFDYYGFPKETYQLKYPAPLDITVTDKVVQSLQDLGGFDKNDIVLDKKRGYDHGVFIPLIIAREKADIPLVQVSLSAVTGNKKDTAKRNLRLGAILSGLRDEGVMIIGSGMSYHNMQGFMNPKSKEPSRKFNNWLLETIKNENDIEDVVYKLWNWTDGPNAIDCHPREEHLLPLMAVVGSEIGVKEIDDIFKNGVDKDKKSGKKIKVEVVTKEEDIIAYSGFAML